MVGGPSIVFTRKAVMDETFICKSKSSNLCKSIVGIDASQLYPYSMCQRMPTGLFMQWEYDSETKTFTARQNKSRSFENMVMSYFQQSRPECKIDSNVTTGRQKKKKNDCFSVDGICYNCNTVFEAGRQKKKKNVCFSVDGICYHCNTVFEAMGCYYHNCPCQEARPSLTDADIERGVKKRQQDEMLRDYIQQKGYEIVEMWECEWWSLYKTDAPVKTYLRANFPHKRPISEEQLLQQVINGRLFGYVQCDIEVPEHLRDYFSNFPPIFKNTLVSRDDFGNLMKEYAEKERIMPQLRRMLISSFILSNNTIITPLLFFLKLGLVCRKIHRFVKNTPRKCFNSFVQSAVDARRQRDKNQNSSVVAETMKLVANSSFGYHIMDRSRHTVTKYLSDEKTHSAIKSNLFKRLNHITDQLYEVELVKSEREHREPIIVGFFILQYAKLKMLELYYNFFKKFCHTDKSEEVEMHTDSPYQALSEENLEVVILPEKRAEWDQLRSKDCTDDFTANATDNFFPRTCCIVHKKHDKREPSLFKEEFRCAKMLCLCSKTYCCYDKQTNKHKFSSKGLNKRTLEECGDGGPMPKYRKVLEEAVNVTSTNRRFRTIEHSAATYEQTKKSLSYFYPKWKVEEGGIHKKLLPL